MKPNQILILGSIVTVILIILWHFKIIGEPIAALGGAIFTLISYLVANKNKSQGEKKNPPNKKITKQRHSGKGDNIGRDKIVNK
ncbi:hypothetical protein [Flammeovirga sp. EKP202]|uniref:hypothetical protein n=1 Tax=Flammeovirga sp. EKP202 TaxID=2770592 RepID=UPI00165FC84B|nr:hypothetical protein [Flammeovirga sp. EKP202]MBD0399985.1 hypothetical protein [Flammeovirga sp. EKP202]